MVLRFISRKASKLMHAVKTAYQYLIVGRKHEVTFWILIAFLLTFVFVRALVYSGAPIFIHVHGTHIHHLTYGIFLLAIAGYLALTVKTPRWQRWIAAFYGVGLALAFDEFGMWLLLRDDYWIRWSYDAALIILVLLINAVYFRDFWFRLLHYLYHTRVSHAIKNT
jgi:hypothetical protein